MPVDVLRSSRRLLRSGFVFFVALIILMGAGQARQGTLIAPEIFSVFNDL